MLSPAAAHRESIVQKAPVHSEPAQKKGAGFVDKPEPEQAYDKVFLAQFRTDKSSLSRIRSLSKRAIQKKSLLVNYQEWIDEAMQAERLVGRRAEMFVWLTIWHIDAGEYQKAFDMALFALEQQIKAPDNFERTLPEIMAEQIADGLNRLEEQALYCNELEDLANLLSGHDLIDPIRAKLCKVRGLALMESDPEQARELLQQALQFNPRAGTKKTLKKLEADQRETVLVSANPEYRNQTMEAYTLSGRQAARRLGVTAPTVLKWAKAQPEQLPHIVVPTGTRKIYRFNPKDIEAFKQNHLVKTS